MVVRLTSIKFVPNSIKEVKRIYNQEIVPEVKQQKGNISIRLLEPVNQSDDFISITEWTNMKDADDYQSSGIYKSLVSKLSDFMAGASVLKTYVTEDVLTTHL